jgi:hypothetical protein
MALKVHGVCPLLEVFDTPTSISFYRCVLGLGVVKTSQPGTTSVGHYSSSMTQS